MFALSTARAISLAAILTLTHSARADDARPPAPDEPPDDYLMPGTGHVSSSVATGVPFLALGEVAFGLGDGFAVGAIGGATPKVGGVGLRPRGVVIQSRRERVELVVPILYYPKTGDSDPWVLARPTLSLEHAFASGARMSFGLGVVGASCIETLVTLGREHDRKVMGGVWNTAGVGGALPISRHASLFGEATVILTGVRPAGNDWIGGPPAVVAVGVETRL